MHSPRARAAFLLLYGALLAWQLDRWCFTPHGIASSWAQRHDGRTAAAGSPGGVSQTFAMGADGLDGVWLRPIIASGVARGELVIDLLQLRGGARQRAERVAIAASTVRTGGALYVPFRPIASSGGKTYQLNVRHVHLEGGPSIDLAATRDDVLATGRFFVDGREQWGDLVFETSARQATLPYWLHDILRPWPAWMSAWPTVVLTLIAVNAILAWACAAATGLVGGPQPALPLPASPRPANAAVVDRLARGVTLAGVAMGVVVTLLPSNATRRLRLIDHVPDARLSAEGPLHTAFSIEPTLFFGRVYRGLLTFPPATVEWTIDVPPGAVFATGAAQRSDLWESESDGFTMRVEIVLDGRSHEIARFGLFPFGVKAHRNLHPAEVSLQPWANRRVLLRLSVDPGAAGHRVNDVAVWTEPTLRWPARVHEDAVLRDER